MAIFSKILNSFPQIKMFIIGEMLPPVGSLTVIGTVVLCFLSFYLFKWLGGEGTVRIRDYVKNHSWTPVTITSRSWYCSICESLLLNGIGVYCDCCGVCADSECIKKANEKLQCKIVTSNSETHLHHWIKGNLPLGATCYVCNEDCSMEPGLVDYQCCWCQRSVHSGCNIEFDQDCDFGRFKAHIVPPWSVQVARRKGAIQKHLLLRGVRDPGWKNWKPLIVIANKKAGNNDGATVLSEFRKYLNPIQVIDLSERKPAAALQWCVLMAPKQLRILVAGGDGTINWVLTTSHKLDLDPEPLLSIIPLGTGNDLSRVLGWGSENSSELDVDNLLKYIETATSSKMDRWKIEVLSHRHLGLRIPSNTLYMYNYFSIGVDAQVCLNFHKTRDSAYYFFGNRIFNKMLYLCFGTQQVVTSDCKNLEKRLDLYIDGKLVNLPELESIVILNIPSWGAGVNLWSEYHSDGECTELGKLNIKPSFLVKNHEVITVLRMFLKRKYCIQEWEDINQLESHLEERRNTPIWQSCENLIEKVMKKADILSNEDEKDEIVQKLCGILDVNTFEIRPPHDKSEMIVHPSQIEALRGLYPRAALMAHDCMSNTHLAVDNDFILYVHASVDIKKGAGIFFNYANVLDGNIERNKCLKTGKYFECTCKRCSDPSELSTNISSLKCHICKKGLIQPRRNDDYKIDWKCTSCEKQFHNKLIETTLNLAKDLIRDAGETRDLEELNEKLQQTFHSQHYLLLELQQILMGLYTQNIPSKRNLMRKIESCRNVIEVTRILGPGISRILGITLYELHAAEANLAYKEYSENEITTETLLQRLLIAEETLKAALKHLLYEPKNSPEGFLAQNALGYLKKLREQIDNIRLDIVMQNSVDKKSKKRTKGKNKNSKFHKNN